MSVELREKENASISYTIKAELYPNDGWHDHKDSWIPLSVISPIDTSFAKYRQSVTASGRTSVGCCATPFRTTSLDICTDKQGFHAGESISFTGVLINRSKDLLKSSITLCQELLFNRHESEAGEPFSMFKVLKTVQTDDLLPCSRLVWEEKGIAIPPRTPLSILNCHLFQLRYFAEVTLRNSDDQKILSVELPFTVGTAPPPPTRVSLRGAHLLRVNTNPAIASTSAASTSFTQTAEVTPGHSRSQHFSRASTSPLLLPPRAPSPGPPAYDDLSFRMRYEKEEETPPGYDDCLGDFHGKFIPSARNEVLLFPPLDVTPSASDIDRLSIMSLSES